MKDPYRILGLARDASPEEVKRAYRRLVMEWHPDRNASPVAEEKFKELTAAYELALDPLRFAEWQAEREDGAAGPQVRLSLEEAANGCERTIVLTQLVPCSACEGSGKERFARSTPCSDCQGCGRLREQRATRICGRCKGRGYINDERCRACDGRGTEASERLVAVKIPPGMLDGEQLRLAAPRGSNADDVYLHIEIEPHALFELRGRDLVCAVPASIFVLLAGGTLEVPTLWGTQAIEIPQQAQNGIEHRVSGMGFPGRGKHAGGDMVLRFEAVYPRALTDAQRALVAELDRLLEQSLPIQAPQLAAWQEMLRARRDSL